ncbi:MAG: DUF2066 domain-containing protein [Gammaproteobacteria bacterium]
MDKKLSLFSGNRTKHSPALNRTWIAILSGFLASILFLCVSPVHAIEVSGLFEAEVPVTNQSAASRKQAVISALRIVLVKLTGDRNAPGRSALSPVMAQAESYMLQFRYRENTSRSGPQAMNLWVQFDEDALNEILRNYGIPVWGKERPSILVWLASQGSAGRRLVNLEDNSGFLEILEKQAQSRGVALIFPLFDLQDSSYLKASDIWGGFREPVILASRRYHADVILTGSIKQVIPSVWEARWTVYIDGQPANWTTQGDLPDVVLDEGIDGLVDILANRYANAGGYVQENMVEISVSDIFNLDQYARALKYLESLNSVTGVYVKRAEPGKVTFQVRAHGGEVVVAQSIALGRILESISSGSRNSYRLLRK